MPNIITLNLPNIVFFIFLLLPLLGGVNILFLTILAKILNVTAYVIISFVLSKTNIKFLPLIGVALFIKMLYFIFGYEIFQTLFLVCTMILIASFSALYYIVATDKFRYYLNLYLLITVPIVVLQALGVFDFLHSWNTLFYVCDGALNCKFNGVVINAIGKAFATSGMNPAQYRPPGFFHSQAILGALVAFSLVINVYPNINKLSISLLACIILVVFGMAKITQIQLIMISGLITLQYGFNGLAKASKIILIWVSILVLYNLLVPGIVYYQLSLDQYIFSIGTRIMDFYSSIMGLNTKSILTNKQMLREITNVGIYVASKSDRGALSGLYQVVWLLPILFLLLYKVRYLYKRNNYGISFLRKELPFAMYITLIFITITQLMVTDTFGTQFVMYFWGLLLVPIFCSKKLLLKKYNGSCLLKLSLR